MSTGIAMPLLRCVPWVMCCLAPLTAIASGPGGGEALSINERVDLIELNHFYDDRGRHAFDQIIFYEWSPDFRRFHVIAWSLIDDDLHRMPTRAPGSDETIVNWFDRDARVYRQIRSKLYRETWGRVDPERANKKLMEEKHRVSLMRTPHWRMR